MLHIAPEQNYKRIALPEEPWSPHRTGTGRVIDKILFYQKRGSVGAV